MKNMILVLWLIFLIQFINEIRNQQIKMIKTADDCVVIVGFIIFLYDKNRQDQAVIVPAFIGI